MYIDGIIFDLDGTLWNSTDGVTSSWNKTLKKYPEEKDPLTVADVKGVMGLITSDIGKELFPYLDRESSSAIVKDCCRKECAYLEKYGAVLYDGLEETLKEMSRRFPLFIVSNCDVGYIEAFFKAHHLRKYFRDYEDSGRTGLKKGDNIKLLMSRNRLKSPVYVGDTGLDLSAARYAGIPFVYARYGFGDVEEYDRAIDSFGSLLNVLR